MYVCLCKAVTDSQLQTAIKQGFCTRKQLVECLGVGGDCGKCNKDIHHLLNEKQCRHLTSAMNEDIIQK